MNNPLLQQWKTPFGNIESDENIINQLLKDKQITSGINLFRQEHGIYTLIPFIKRALPNSKIVPLVLKQSNNYQYFHNPGPFIQSFVIIMRKPVFQKKVV